MSVVMPVSPGPRVSLCSSAADFGLSQAARQIRESLRNYPHFVVVTSPGAADDPNTLIALAHAVADSSTSHHNGERRVSFSNIRIDPEVAAAPRKSGTRHSRTNHPMAPHTDSSFDANPHRLVAFQCVNADDSGGESLLVPLEDIMANAADNLLSVLRETAYPLGKRLRPILTGGQGHEEIRYYRAQLDRALRDGCAHLADRHRAAIDQLDAILDRGDIYHRVRLHAGEILFMHNRKVLHGRTGFSSASGRHFFRIRLKAPRLEFDAMDMVEAH